MPLSSAQAPFVVPTHPGRVVALDLETFYPWGPEYPQADTEKQLSRRRKLGKGHSFAVDPRRNLIRFLTIWSEDGSLGERPMIIDMAAAPELPPAVLDAIANSTLIGHNIADFDVGILRRYGISVSREIRDTMVAARLLGLGDGRAEGFRITQNPRPRDNRLGAVVRRYLHIEMEKLNENLGKADWGRRELSPQHFKYMAEDVGYLPELWRVLELELRQADLEKTFLERMEFISHLNEIKMAGLPADASQLEADRERVSMDLGRVSEELREMFKDYRHPVPPSRAKKSACQDEEFSPTNRNHWKGALEAHGVCVENTQEETLNKINAPECELLLRHSKTEARLKTIERIIKSTFPDGRVRASKWDPVGARSGRLISSGPNLQQLPRDWRTAFRVDPPRLWLKADLHQIEVLIAAHLTGDENLISLINRGEDSYTVVAARLFDVEPVRGEREGQVTDSLRTITKPILLGTFYGLTAYGLVYQIRNELRRESSVQEAQGYIDIVFEMFPRIAAYHEKAAQEALEPERESVRTAGGLRRFLPPLRFGDQEGNHWPSFNERRKMLLNHPIQGGCADLQVRAANKFMAALPPDVEVVNLVHDEADLIIPSVGCLEPIKAGIRAAYVAAFGELFDAVITPTVDFTVGPSWGKEKAPIQAAL